MEEASLPEDLKQCVAFHGHLCPGVVIGYCAAKLGMRELSAQRAGDEELIAIVENDTCAVDAVQVLTGCTFGKGNLFFHDHGKMVFTFAVRPSGKSVRLSCRRLSPPGIDTVPDNQRRSHQIEFMLASRPEDLFDVRPDALASLPEAARIHESTRCDECGETAMATRIQQVSGRSLCIPCSRTADHNDHRESE